MMAAARREAGSGGMVHAPGEGAGGASSGAERTPPRPNPCNPKTHQRTQTEQRPVLKSAHQTPGGDRQRLGNPR